MRYNIFRFISGSLSRGNKQFFQAENSRRNVQSFIIFTINAPWLCQFFVVKL